MKSLLISVGVAVSAIVPGWLIISIIVCLAVPKYRSWAFRQLRSLKQKLDGCLKLANEAFKSAF